MSRGTEITSDRPFAIYMPALAWEDVTSPPQDLGLDLGFGRPWARPGTSIGKMPGPRAGSRGSPLLVALGLQNFLGSQPSAARGESRGKQWESEN